MPRAVSIVVLFQLAAGVVRVAAQQSNDSTYARLVREATTDPHFLPASVATVPPSQATQVSE